MDTLSIQAACNSIVVQLHEARERETAVENNVSDASIIRGGESLLECLTGLQTLETGTILETFHKIKSLVDFSQEKFYAFPHKQVPNYLRQLHTDTSIAKSICEVYLAIHQEKEDNMKGNWKEVISTLDKALIMSGAPGIGRKEVIFQLIEISEKKLKSNDEENSMELTNSSKGKSTSSIEDRDPGSSDIPVINFPILKHQPPPSILSFISHVQSAQPTPLIIPSSILHWPALSTRPWKNLDYLRKVVGEERMVPVEIGAKYTDEKWSQELMSFGEFLKNCEKNSDDHADLKHNPGSDVAYLAQHNLFYQIPRLMEDISIPDYIPREDVIINAWFGPKGTISPMHTDPYHNIFAQVVGKKYVRLYAPEETSKLYPFNKNGFLGNTSQIDAENPDHVRFPKFQSANYEECILSPGDLLYIPPGWWHYVRSLSISFSVSFWF